jgi:hypothetical protein
VPSSTILNGGGHKGCEVEPGAGDEPAEECWLVLHPLEPGLDQRGQLGGVAFGEGWPGLFSGATRPAS